MEEQTGSIGKMACPQCGVMVATGYVACPKCKAALPKKTQTQMSGHKLKQGGTSAAERGISLGMIAIAAAVAAVGWYLASREPPELRGEKIIPRKGPAAPAKGAEPAKPEPGDAPSQAPSGDTQALLMSLDGKLRTGGVSAWVDIDSGDPQWVLVRSDNCRHERVAQTVEGFREHLALSFTGWRCVERFNRFAADHPFPQR